MTRKRLIKQKIKKLKEAQERNFIRSSRLPQPKHKSISQNEQFYWNEFVGWQPLPTRGIEL